MITAKVRPYNNTSLTGSTMQDWTGTYKQTTASAGEDIEAYAENGYLVIGFTQAGGPAPLQWKMDHLDVRYNEHMDVTFVRPFAGEPSCVVIPGKQAADRLNSMIGYRPPPIRPNHNRQGWSRLLLFLAGIIVVLVALYLLLVPYIAEKIASKVSPSTEESFGESIYEGLNLTGQTDPARTALANRFFAEMDVPTTYRIRITVVNGPVVNAFALPGGHIVVYTGLLDKLGSYPELAALLGHEFTHVQLQHSTKSVFRKMGSKVFISLVLGRNGAIGSVLAGQADELKSLQYSRSLEQEADLNGLAILRERQIDPAGFSGLFTRLKTGSPAGEMPEILASHPDISQRIKYVKEAAGNYPVKQDSILLSIFEQLKK